MSRFFIRLLSSAFGIVNSQLSVFSLADLSDGEQALVLLRGVLISFRAFFPPKSENDPRNHTKSHQQNSLASCDFVDRFTGQEISQSRTRLRKLSGWCVS